jgi:protein ImuB
MDRLACVSVPEFALQLLLQDEPDWRDRPVAVVEHDRPQGVVLLVNEAARAQGVLPGMSFAQGLSLARGLHAAVMPAARIETGVTGLTQTLRRFSPTVEPATDEPGIFWLGATGLSPLFRSATQWGELVGAAVDELGFTATVVVGFGRFAGYALARSRPAPAVWVLARPEQEQAAMRRVPLARLTLAPKQRDTLATLGVRTVGDFLQLPAAGLRRRFGLEAWQLYQRATDRAHEPLTDRPEHEPARRVVQFEPPDANATRLVFAIKGQMHPLLRELARRGRALARLELRFTLERAAPWAQVISPAEPTLTEALLVDLVRLRLEGAPLPAAVEEIELVAHEAAADEKQLRMFFDAPKRDLEAGNRALARLRALLGEPAVVRAKLTAGHLPEASFTWEPLTKLQPAQPPAEATPTLVRRMHARPIPLAGRDRNEPDGWLVRGFGMGPVVGVWGPYIVSGGWWRREVQRRYYFVETQRGDLLWIFYDARRRRWYWHGQVQ